MPGTPSHQPPDPRTKRRNPVPEKQGMLLEVPTKKAARCGRRRKAQTRRRRSPSPNGSKRPPSREIEPGGHPKAPGDSATRPAGPGENALRAVLGRFDTPDP